MNRFHGINVLLTGGGSEIGRATVIRLVSEGAAVVAVDRDSQGLDETAECAVGPGRVLTHEADVTDETAVQEAVAAAAIELGSLEVLVNVAGVYRGTPIERLSVHDLHELYTANLVGAALFCRETLPHLPDQVGVIVNVTSAAASRGIPYMSAYSASEGALRAFSLSLAAEVVGRGIRVEPVSAGIADTPLTGPSARARRGDDAFGCYGKIYPPFRLASPEQIAATIVFAASRDAGYLTGAEIPARSGAHI